MSTTYRVQVTVTEIEKAEVTKDRYNNVTTEGRDSETELLKGSYALDAITRPRIAQEVTDFLSRLSGRAVQA